jgi:methionine-rich copper-binding protein CopC
VKSSRRKRKKRAKRQKPRRRQKRPSKMMRRKKTAKLHLQASWMKGTVAVAVGFCALAIISLALTTATADAHARYESSTPADGEVVAEPPERVDIFFSQEMARSQGLPTVRVANESGDVVADEAVLDDEDRTHLSIELPPELPEGRYTVIWHNISDEDGDDAEGAFHFYIGTGPEATPSDGTDPPNGESPTAAPTTPPDDDGNNGDDGVPAWTLALAALGGAVVGGVGVAALRRR